LAAIELQLFSNFPFWEGWLSGRAPLSDFFSIQHLSKRLPTHAEVEPTKLCAFNARTEEEQVAVELRRMAKEYQERRWIWMAAS
jgi:hypothetical protein